MEDGSDKSRALVGEAGNDQGCLQLDVGARRSSQNLGQAVKQAMTNNKLLALAVANNVVLDDAQEGQSLVGR